MCYLDDFVRVESSKDRAAAAYARFNALAHLLGLQPAPDKCVPPTTSLTWLGFTLDMISMSVYIPPEKVYDVLEECATWKTKKISFQVSVAKPSWQATALV